MSEKIPLVLFSGGLDSTVMLWKYLQTTPVDVLYADGGQHPLKIEKELECRKRTIEFLNRVMPYKVQTDLRTDNNVSFASGPGNKYSQPMAWMVAALSVLDPTRHKSLSVGYVGDDGGFLRYIPNLYSAWENMQILSKVGEPVPLVFPVVDNRKVDLLGAMPTELLDSIWVCEMPNSEDGVVRACKKCTPCKLGASVLHQFEQENGYSIYSKRLVKQLRTAEEDSIRPWKGRDLFAHQTRRVAGDWTKDSSDPWYYRHPKKADEEEPELKLTDSN